MDDAIESFTSIAGSTPQIARHYLGLTEGNLEQAIQLFFDSPDLGSGIAETPAPSAAPRAAPSGGANVIDIDSDDEEGSVMDLTDDTPSEPARAPAAASGDYEDDEAMARRMQEELYAGGDSAGGFGADGVRAPIARTTETLVGPGAADWGEPMPGMYQQMRAFQQRRGESAQIYRRGLRRTNPGTVARPGVFNQQATASASSASIWNDPDPQTRRERLAEATGGASEQNSKTAKLAELYRPPFELMCRLTWDDARQQGKDDEKWIMVNIQDPSIFDCQGVNRDLWRDDAIKETIKEHFLFMQYDKNDHKGMQYMQYYFPNRDNDAAYPHIAIVDPRTGEQVKVWSGKPVPKAGDFLMQLYEFLDRYSLSVGAKNPVAKRKPEKSASLDVAKLTDQEMLELAMKNSLANTGEAAGSKGYDPDDLTKSVGDLGGKGKGKEVEEDSMDVGEGSAPEAATNTAFAGISSTNAHTEPARDPATVTQIQIRHSDGRIIRRFALSDPVRRIYEWLKAEPLEGKQGVEFELRSMGKDLIQSLDETIADAGLKNGTVMVEYLQQD